MEQNLETADFAIMVCTKRYVSKANTGEGGVGYEKMIMTSSSLAKISDSKVIPIVRENGEPKVPTFLKTKLYVDFSKDEDFEYAIDELLRVLLKSPLYEKPAIGTNPFRPLSEARPDRAADGVKQIMSEVVDAYNNISREHVLFDEVLKRTTMPRLKFDKYYTEAINIGYLQRAGIYLLIADKGRQYAEEHGLFEA